MNRWSRTAGAVTLTVLVAAGCTSNARDQTAARVPLPPPTPRQTLGASEPPVIWLGGILRDVTVDHLLLQEDSGSVATLQRLAEGATGFYRVAGSSWAKLAPSAQIPAGQRACIETLMDGTNLLAIRVFLGAGCGPI
jgi:hypothetical protein